MRFRLRRLSPTWWALGALLLALLAAPRPSEPALASGDPTPAPVVGASLNDDAPAGASATDAPRFAASGRELVVGPAGEFVSLTAALAAATDGDRIRVIGGTHTDVPLTVEKRVELVGENWPVLDGQGREGILTITAPGAVVRGFELRDTGASHVRDHAAIRVERASGVRIEGNLLVNSNFGIYLARANEAVVVQNELRGEARTESSSGNGIHLWDVHDALVADNSITGHRDGIYLEFAKRARIQNNVSKGNLRYGLHFMFSDDSVYDRNTFAGNGAGVAVMYSRRVVMTGNRFEDNWGTAAYGLLLKDVQDSEIERNVFRQNTTAIYSEGTDRLTFRQNRVERNGWAVKIQANSQDNSFIENAFVENTFDVVTNSRRSYNTFDRNYWSRYSGYDLNGDGIGDIPYRPVRLFSFIVENEPIAIILLRSFFVDLLDMAERVLPVLTPETLVDANPLMNEVPL